MKKLLISLFTAIMLVGCFTVMSVAYFDIFDNKTTYDATKGAPAYVLESRTIKSNITGEAVCTIKYKYDKKGNLILEDIGEEDCGNTKYTYDSANRLTGMTDGCDTWKSCAYDKYGNLVKYENDWRGEYYTYSSKGNMLTRIIDTENDRDEEKFTYDIKGRLIKSTGKNSDGETWTETYSYNSNDVLTKSVKKIVCDVEDSVETVTKTYKYDSNGNLIKKVETSSFRGESIYTWAYSGKNLTKYEYSYDGELSESHVYTYDSKGRPLKDVYRQYYGEGSYSESSYTTTYDSKGRIVKIVCIDGVTETQTYTYNSNGVLTKSVLKDYDGTHTYVYDSNGYITKKIISYPDGDSETITYTNKKFSSDARMLGNRIFIEYASVYADGKAKTPNIVVKNMKNGVDYKVTYSNNVKPGTAKAIIKFAEKYIDGRYTAPDPITVTYTIKKLPAQVTGLKQLKVTASTFQLTWTKYPTAKYYRVQYTTDGKTWKNYPTLATTNSLILKSLKAGTKYQFRVVALDSSKKTLGKASAVLKTQTLCAAPSTIKLTSTKSKTATVSWSKVTGATGYYVAYSKDNKTWTKKAITGTSYTIKSLVGGKKVYVKVQATNSYKLNGGYSAVKNITVKK